MDEIIFFLSAFVFSFIGAFTGSGGGYLIVPFLLFLTDLSPQVIAGTSLTVVFISKISSMYGYYRQCRIDYKLSKYMILAIIPGVFIGFSLNQHIQMRQYSMMLSGFLLLLAYFMLTNRAIIIPRLPFFSIQFKGKVVDSCGNLFEYAIGLRRSMILSFSIGIISPLFGIGGGVILTPIMILAMGIPAKIAAATAQYITFSTTTISMVLFLSTGNVDIHTAFYMSLGVVFGAISGAKYSFISNERLIRLIISLTLGICGLSLIYLNIR